MLSATISPLLHAHPRVDIVLQAHGMLPHLGAGAGQGIEDAYLLGKLLGHPQTTLANIPVRAPTIPSTLD